MVRVPGSSGDSGFHRESHQEDAQVKREPGTQASTDDGSPTTPLNNARSTDRQSAGRNSVDGTEEGPETGLEEKPHPPYASLEAPADRDANRDPPDEGPSVKTEEPSPTTTPLASRSSSKKKKARSSRKKLKAPDSDLEEQGKSTTSWTEDQLELAFHRKELYAFLVQDPIMKILRPRLLGDLLGPVTSLPDMPNKLDAVKALLSLLREAGITSGAFDADVLFDADLDSIKNTLTTLFKHLKKLVGSISVKTETSPLPRTPEYQTGSSHYASAASDVSSNSSIDSGLQRMTLGPAGAAMLQARSSAQVPQTKTIESDQSPIPTTASTDSTSRMQSFFNVAMSRFLQEQQAPTRTPSPSRGPKQKNLDEDVDMESVGSMQEYDPDDLDLFPPRQAAVASAATTGSQAAFAPRIRVSAISDLKEFSGKDCEEEQAWSWISKVKSAFTRDQAPDEEKCVVLGNLLTGPARNWYRQLSRTTRGNWKELLEGFQTQYCGLGVSVARQYYHARKRSEETPLDYLYRLNVAGLRAKLNVKEGSPRVCREHVEHFIETLDDRDLADQLTLLRLPDADALEETLRARQRTKSRQRKAAYGSSKFRQKAPTAQSSSTPPPKQQKPAREIRAIRIPAESSRSEEESSGSESEGDLRRMFAMTTEDSVKQETRIKVDQQSDQDTRPLDSGTVNPRCSHCGSSKHNDLGCWKRLTCQKCGKRGHPSDRCLFVCRGCGELHDPGKCQMEEFYNMIRQWYNPAKHAGMLPASAEKMLN